MPTLAPRGRLTRCNRGARRPEHTASVAGGAQSAAAARSRQTRQGGNRAAAAGQRTVFKRCQLTVAGAVLRAA